ncbi:MAG: CAP domain-containing protein [Desulforhopalus sp.]|nr:CAP domain-containing protein [Desulforhopalus sp.]
MSQHYPIIEDALAGFSSLRGFILILRGLVLIVCLFIPWVTCAATLEPISAEQVLAEINLARTNPVKYAEFLRELRRQFQGDSYYIPGYSVAIRTIEGPAAVDEAIDFLTRQKPLPPLIWSAKLAAVAAELAQEQSKSGAVGHEGGSSGGLLKRIKRSGIREKRIGENVAYGAITPRGIVIDLLIDDGVPGRGHRKNQFDRNFAKAGVSCGIHPRYQTMCVIDFAGAFKE